MVHQSSLCYKDLALRHFVVSSTSVRRARVINWKSVYVMYCCVQYVEKYTEQRAFADSINFFVFIWRKLLLDHIDYFDKFMVNIFHRKIRVNDGFGVSLVVNSKLPTRNMKNRQKFEDVESQTLLEKDDSQTQKQLAE